jgi:two-component system, LytTR family, sensor kinase
MLLIRDRQLRLVQGFALATAIGLLLAGHKYLGYVTGGRAVSPLAPVIDEVGAAWAVALAVPALVRLARRYPLDRSGWVRRVPLHLGAALAFGAYHTSAMWLSRAAAYPLAGLGGYDYGRMPVRYAMEFPQQLIIFGIVTALTYMYDRQRAAQQRELRISQLETEVVRARLDTLRMQLNPHFLFNALNTVSSVMYESLDAADEVLTRLGELLRRSMRDEQTHEVALRHELETLNLYLDIMRARFGDLLAVQVDAATQALDAPVPSMLLQPLVENAIQHGRDPAAGVLHIEVACSVAGTALRIEVRDTGRGTRSGELRRGVGLGNTAERLRRLYGDAQRMEAGSTAGGGFRVLVEFPFRAAAAGTAEAAPRAGEVVERV